MIVSLLAGATSLPIEDTAEVAAAKAEFNAAFAAAEAGDHAALAPVNSDTQAAQIAAEYLADVEEVAAARAAFQAAYDNIVAEGLADKQEPAPVHEIPAPAPLAAPEAGAGIPYGVSGLTAVGGYPYAVLPAYLPYHALPLGLPYTGLALVPAPVKEE